MWVVDEPEAKETTEEHCSVIFKTNATQTCVKPIYITTTDIFSQIHTYLTFERHRNTYSFFLIFDRKLQSKILCFLHIYLEHIANKKYSQFTNISHSTYTGMIYEFYCGTYRIVKLDQVAPVFELKA